jgi:hypothetical protein
VTPKQPLAAVALGGFGVDESERLQAADLAADRGVVAPDLIGEGADREVALHRDADEQREQRGVQRDAGPGQDQVVALGPVEDVVGTPRLVSSRGADFWIRLKAAVSATLPKWRQREVTNQDRVPTRSAPEVKLPQRRSALVAALCPKAP